MSEFRIDQITNQAGTAGPQVAGITTFNSPSGLVMPSGNTSRRYVSDFVPNNVITDGLVLYLDAGNTVSYPGSGTTWTDLSGQGNNGTLVNGVGYDSANGGSLSFDGVNDVINLPLSTNLRNTSYTIFGFLKSDVSIQNGTSERYLYYFRGTTDGTNRFGVLFGFSTNVTSNNGKIALVIGNGVWNTYSSSRSSWNANTWYNIAVTQSGTTYKIYVDGIQTDTGTAVVPIFSGMDLNILGNKWDGNISSSLVYNRALTPQEIQQNYNALKGRYI